MEPLQRLAMVNQPRRNRIYSDPFWTKLDRQRSAQYSHGPFACIKPSVVSILAKSYPGMIFHFEGLYARAMEEQTYSCYMQPIFVRALPGGSRYLRSKRCFLRRLAWPSAWPPAVRRKMSQCSIEVSIEIVLEVVGRKYIDLLDFHCLGPLVVEERLVQDDASSSDTDKVSSITRTAIEGVPAIDPSESADCRVERTHQTSLFRHIGPARP